MTLTASPGPDSLSIVLPVFNERPALEPLFAELLPVLRALGRPFEIVAVDDGSTDGSGDELERLCAGLSEARWFGFPENRGKSAALFRAFEEARGSWVVTLDSDLQDDPGNLPRLLERVAAATAPRLVIGIRQRADTWWRKLVSRTGNWGRRAVLRDGIVDIGCGLRVLPRAELEGLPRFEGVHRFIPSLLRARGVEVVQVPITHRPRPFGESKYATRSRAGQGLVHLVRMWRWTRKARAERRAR